MNNKKNRWDISQMPDLNGKVAIVTGGNRGLGLEIVMQLLKKNAEVVMASRNEKKAFQAIAKIHSRIGYTDKVQFIPLNLLEKKSIVNFSAEFKKTYSRLDFLFNNAALVNLKNLEHTNEGYELQMATNHFAPFILTHELFDILLATDNSRIINVNSGAYKFGTIDFNDLHWSTKKYKRGQSYGSSKLANLLFTKQLQKKLTELKSNTIALSAHPGLSATERQQSEGMGGIISKILASPVSKGVESLLRVAVDKNAKGEELYGPRYGLCGASKSLEIKHNEYTDEMSEKLWKYTEEVTGIKF
ncbi:MAG: SDR family NAD(P)-dependent oxidoreductase [Rhodothermaceae bacterium]